jgi:hypothetical protein
VPDDGDFGEVSENLTVARKHHADVAPGAKRAGQRGRNSGESANADEVIDLGRREKDLQLPPRLFSK